MKTKPLLILIIALALIVLAEAIVYLLGRAGVIDFFGAESKKERQIKGNVWGVAGLASLSSAQDLGSQWAHLSLSWQEVEKQGWAGFEKQIQNLAGQQLVATIFSDSRSETLCPRPEEKDRSCPPINLEKYQEFVSQAAGKSQGKIQFWQIEDGVFNQTSRWQGNQEQYLKLLQAAHTTLKKQSADNQIVLAGIWLKNLNVGKEQNEAIASLEKNLTQIFSEGRRYFDIVDVHLFSPIQLIETQLNWLSQQMELQGFLKPIWLLELGGPNLSQEEYSEEFQAEQAVKRFLTGFAAGAEKILYYHFQDQADSTDPLAATLGLKDSSGQPKPAYVSYQVMAQNLANFNHLRQLDLKVDGVTGFQLSFPSRQPIFVFWAETPVKISLPAEIKNQAKAFDYLGQAREISQGKVEVGRAPVYIQLK